MTPTSNSDQTWRPGQRAVINRQRVVVIDKVTPSGRATVGHQTFNPDGMERSTRLRRDRLEPLTPEIEAEMALVQRAREMRQPIQDIINKAEQWLLRALSTYDGRIPDPADVARAETLAAAIREVLEP